MKNCLVANYHLFWLLQLFLNNLLKNIEIPLWQMPMNNLDFIIQGSKFSITPDLLDKYNRQLPRYTSYPTAPIWTKNTESINFPLLFKEKLRATKDQNISLYIHIPFCKTRCSFCGCSSIVSNNPETMGRYVNSIIKELDFLQNRIDTKKIKINSLHWGGGTPTHLTQTQIEKIQNHILKCFGFSKQPEISIETNPDISIEMLGFLKDAGFNRISFGIQDLNETVLNACGRKFADIKKTRHLIDHARSLDYKSINIDLCYGLPNQTKTNFELTIKNIINISPDRISLFNFAYIPQTLKHQQIINPDLLPCSEDKLSFFVNAINLLSEAGYDFIGMDHFAKKEDELCLAKSKAEISRGFQGYSAKPLTHLIGVGLTSISSFPNLYVQNEKDLESYIKAVESGNPAIIKGFLLSRDDEIRRWIIQRIFCQQFIDKIEFEKIWCVNFNDYFKEIVFNELIKDNLIINSSQRFDVTLFGRLFLRNIASIFDKYLDQKSLFSKTI